MKPKSDHHRITKAEYDNLRRQGFAGRTADLLPEPRSHWDAPYWSLQHTVHGPTLVPTEIANDE